MQTSRESCLQLSGAHRNTTLEAQSNCRDSFKEELSVDDGLLFK